MFESRTARDRLQLCAFLVIVVVWFAVLVLCGINVHHGNDRASETNEYGDGIVVQRTACEEESNDETKEKNIKSRRTKMSMQVDQTLRGVEQTLSSCRLRLMEISKSLKSCKFCVNVIK